ncbi:MAG: lycopene beta-cyclase [Glaciecola sp.]|jgi:lycopene beta-cyclase
MADKSNYDVIIIGAGAAGISLLLALQERQYAGSVKVLEKSTHLKNDRMWSFWHKQDIPNYIQKIISQDWHQWSLSVDTATYSMLHPEYRYSCIRAESLLQLGLQAFAQNTHFDIEFDCDVKSIQSFNKHALVKTKQGTLSASLVVDTRPPPLHHKHNGMLQSFYGEEIRSDIDIFEPSEAKLMEQLACSALGIEFVYILPFSTKHALVEFTCFSPSVIDIKVLKMRLKTYLETNLQLKSYKVERIESAVLPMYQINQNTTNKQQRLVYGGIAGGAMRASTGYSFLSSQRWAISCANNISNKKSLSTYTPVNFVYQKMDALMLSIIRKNPIISLTIFSQIFIKVSPARFVRFMTERASILDLLAVIWVMPKRVFLKALFTHFTSKPSSNNIDEINRE